jgi:hypothetical protein
MTANDVFGMVLMAVLFVLGCFYSAHSPVTSWDCSRGPRGVRCTVEDKAVGLLLVRRTAVEDVRAVKVDARNWRFQDFGTRRPGPTFTLTLVDGAGAEHPTASHSPFGSRNSDFHLGDAPWEIRDRLQELIAGQGGPVRARQIDWAAFLIAVVFIGLPLLFFPLMALAPALPWNRARPVRANRWVRSFLDTIPCERAVAALMGVLNDGDERLRAAACDALGAMGPVAVEALPALNGRLDDRSERVRRAAAAAIARIGTGPPG